MVVPLKLVNVKITRSMIDFTVKQVHEHMIKQRREVHYTNLSTRRRSSTTLPPDYRSDPYHVDRDNENILVSSVFGDLMKIEGGENLLI